ncbi:MAG: metal ABC transporter permease [Oscillospiraceae bacterium]|nr:metal ABC transporter permease [Oscillospiraceae bacterium]
MKEIMEKFILYFQYPFVRYALIVSVLIALCSSLLGVTLVLKRFSFIGDGLSHVAFGAVAIAAAINLTDNFFLMLPVTVICAILLLRTGQNTKIKGDAAIAMISVGALAVGYIVMNLFSKSSNIAGDVCTSLFGSTSMLTLTEHEVWLCVVLSVLVIFIFLFFYHKIFAVTFDEDFSMATGVRAKIYNLALAVIIAVVIVLAMNLVGALLISALVIFPALSAMRVFKSFKAVTVCSAVVSAACAVLGILISIVGVGGKGTPAGATIVAVDIAVFFVFCAAGSIARKIASKDATPFL